MSESIFKRIRENIFPSNGKALQPRPKGLGTFLGVYTPTILTILGVIMYLRFGWVVGQVGLLQTLVIVVLANAITLATSFSLSAIATNSKVGGGGAYFMISRSLGLEVGGAIGLPLFLSQALSVTLYAYGLAESLRILFPALPLGTTAFVIILLVGAISQKGAEVALKIQMPMLVLIGLSLGALGSGVVFNEPIISDMPITEAVGFWQVFAIFFPAVTGIMAGLSLSGDLRDPASSIPRGTLLAALTGFAVYLVVPVLLTIGADPASLVNEPLIWTRIATLGPWFVLPGLWGAIFSSAVGSMLGAPRTLQALSLDRLGPRFLRKSIRGKHGERICLLATLIIALGATLLGELNTVATVVALFFLTVYGVINLVAALEHLSGNPSWRPRIKLHWGLALLGALSCFGVMLLINPVASLIALSIELGLWLFLKRRIRKERWGDLWRDLYEVLIRWALIRLSRRTLTARNWRPHPLVFVGDVERRLDLVQFASWFGESRGIVTVVELVEGDIMTLDVDPVARGEEMESILHDAGIGAFGEVDVVRDVARGIVTVAQANGLGNMEANTVVVGWPDNIERLVAFLKVIRPLEKLHRSLLIGRIVPLAPLREDHIPTIHIWWGGLERNGDLQLLLAYLLTCNPEWRNAKIKILSFASSELMAERTRTFLAKLIPEIRIDVDVDVRLREPDIQIKELMKRESAEADLVMLGLARPEAGKELELAERLHSLTEGLPSCFLVHNGSLFIGELVTPSQEEIAEETPADLEPEVMQEKIVEEESPAENLEGDRHL